MSLRCPEQHTYKYIHIRPYTCTYMVIHANIVEYRLHTGYIYLHIHAHTWSYMQMLTYICHIQATYTFVCMSAHNRPKTSCGGAITRGPHSGHPWAAALPLYPAISDPFPDPFWRTRARCTRGGGQSCPPAPPMGLQSQWALDDPVLSPVQADLGRWCCA